MDDKRIYLDDEIVYNFSLTIGNEHFNINKENEKQQELSLYFESNLLKLSKRIQEKYRFQCCFTCQYSDYSPYGNDDYGSMLCYKKHKQEYLKVNCKDDFFQYLEGIDYEGRQETYLCEEYEPRIYCEGYRGKISM